MSDLTALAELLNQHDCLDGEPCALLCHAADELESAEAKLDAIENILTLTEIACHDKVAVKAIRRILNGEEA